MNTDTELLDGLQELSRGWWAFDCSETEGLRIYESDASEPGTNLSLRAVIAAAIEAEKNRPE